MLNDFVRTISYRPLQILNGDQLLIRQPKSQNLSNDSLPKLLEGEEKSSNLTEKKKKIVYMETGFGNGVFEVEE